MNTTTTGTPVAIDGDYLAATAAYVAPENWNGWAVPYFTVDQGLALVAQSRANAERYGADDTDVIAWDHTREVFTITRDDETYDVDTIERDGVTLHGIGAWGWVWSVVDDEAPSSDDCPVHGAGCAAWEA